MVVVMSGMVDVDAGVVRVFAVGWVCGVGVGVLLIRLVWWCFIRALSLQLRLMS